MSVSREWQFRMAVAALLATMGVVQVVTAAGEMQTWDEAIHLSAGYSYLKTGNFKLNQEHPPLFKELAALPLLLLKPSLPLEDPSWENGGQIEFGRVFLYTNRVPADRILMYGRSVTILLSLALGLVLALWTRRHFGTATALGALFLYTFDPNLIAHGRYVTNDLMVTFFTFVVVIAWARFLETKRWRNLAGAGLLLGLGLVSKFSALFLIPLIVLLYLIKWWQQGAEPEAGGRKLSLKHGLSSLAVVAAISVAVIGLVYGPETMRSLTGPALNEAIKDSSSGISQVLQAAGDFFDLPAHPYLLGLNLVGEFAKGGHHAYLLGMHSMFGWWYYFPVVFAVKTPTAVLLLLVVCLGIGVRRLAEVVARKDGVVSRLRRLPFRWVTVTVPLVVYCAVMLTSPVNLGVRYLLPVYPLLFILLSAVVMPRARVWMVVAVAALVLFESVRIFPDYLAFFNTVSGGPGNGPRYLADSNIDWGQDLKKLRRYLDGTGWKGDVCFCYFGSGRPEYYGIHGVYLPETKDVEQRRQANCLAAISVTMLEDVYSKPGTFAWLRELKPIAKVGYSIYIYDLRQRRTP